MSIENKNVIDVVSVDKEENVILTISDHLEWDLNNEHLLILQDKINAYLGAIKNGELYKNYPKAKGKKIIIRIIALHYLKGDAKVFLDRVKATLKNTGYGFEFEQKSLGKE